MDDTSYLVVNFLLIGGMLVTAYEAFKNNTAWAWISTLTTFGMLVVING